jgi:hypothetical protein
MTLYSHYVWWNTLFVSSFSVRQHCTNLQERPDKPRRRNTAANATLMFSINYFPLLARGKYARTP